MSEQTLANATVEILGEKFSRGEVSSLEATEACLAREGSTHHFGAYLHVCAERARKDAQLSDARRAAGNAIGPLDGVPVAVKDLLLDQGLPTTCGSKILKNFVATYDATVVSRLKAAGAVLLGKLNLDEFAMGSSNEHSAYGKACNPWDPERVPGGSSGGSAVAVAAGSAFATLGTDTGGSIRQPAAMTGVVGIKPTYGRVSRFGAVAYASSLDQVGPMGKTVRDVAWMLQAIAGHDPHDATSSSRDVPDFTQLLERGVQGLKIGVPKEYFVDGIDPEIQAAIKVALALLEKNGATVREISLPHTEHGIAAYYLIATAEASSNLARYDGVRYGVRAGGAQGLMDMYLKTRSEGFGFEVKKRIMLGTYVLSAGYYDAYYLKAQKARALIKRDFDEALRDVDVIVAPVTPTPAFKHGENLSDPMAMYLADIFTVCLNLAGLPGLSLPCGFTGSGLPIGMQIIGKPFDEATILQVARAYERETPWHTRRAVS